jgi:hypothetical protein
MSFLGAAIASELINRNVTKCVVIFFMLLGLEFNVKIESQYLIRSKSCFGFKKIWFFLSRLKLGTPIRRVKV